MKILIGIVITYLTLKLVSSMAEKTSIKLNEIESSVNDENVDIKTKERNFELIWYFARFLFIGYVYLYLLLRINNQVVIKENRDDINILSYAFYML